MSVVFLMGPTAAGKTALALRLAAQGRFGLISVDSAMVYRGMDIGTAKPDAATLAAVPHALIDVVDPDTPYSAARFRADAHAAVATIRAQGRVPLLVGGTGLYFRAFSEGLSELPGANPDVRRRLQAELGRLGLAALHARLRSVDPAAAARIHPNDTQRTLRALEVYELTGRPLSAQQCRGGEDAAAGHIVRIVLAPAERAVLHARIEARFRAMLAAGLVEEVQALRERHALHAALPSMRCVGYRQAWQHLEGEFDAATLAARGTIATRQLAKRQLTWFRREPQAHWFDSDAGDTCERALALLGREGIV